MQHVPEGVIQAPESPDAPEALPGCRSISDDDLCAWCTRLLYRPVWLVILSDQLGIVALVSRYPTNKLIPSGHIRWQEARGSPSLVLRRYAVLATVSSSYPPPSGSFPDITHPSATRIAPAHGTCTAL